VYIPRWFSIIRTSAGGGFKYPEKGNPGSRILVHDARHPPMGKERVSEAAAALGKASSIRRFIRGDDPTSTPQPATGNAALRAPGKVMARITTALRTGLEILERKSDDVDILDEAQSGSLLDAWV
jgi:hypothetical protein